MKRKIGVTVHLQELKVETIVKDFIKTRVTLCHAVESRFEFC
jgi:hypothetical protein